VSRIKAAAGLGLVFAKQLAAEGARVAICGRDPEALERARESQSATSPSWLTRLGDDAARRHNQIAPWEGASA
jgi:short-subunit dehydrogenase involved in D-alanine esterification of teichoic acids